MIPTSLHFIFAGLILLISLVQIESPRYLVRKGKTDGAVSAMCRLYKLPPSHPYVIEQMTAIEQHWQVEQETSKGQGFVGLVKEIFLVPRNLFPLYLGICGQLLAQWSGAGSITM